MLLQNQECFVISSGGKNVINKSSDGSSFFVSYSNTPIEVPKDAISATIEIIYASIWNTFYNVVSNNNFFTFKGQPYVLYQPSNYTVDTLNQEVQRINQTYGAGYDLVFSWSDIHQRIQASTASGGQLAFVGAPFALIVGWNIGDIINIVAGVPSYAPNISDFSTFDDIYVHSDIVSNGIDQNNEYNNIIGIIPNFVGANFNINYDPNQTIKIDAMSLKNAKNLVRVWITDENDKPLNTGGLDYSITLLLKWTTPMILKDENGKPILN